MTSLTAINVLLKPDVATRERAKAINALLRGDLPSSFALDATHEPHLTVLQRYVRRADLEDAIAAVGDVAANGVAELRLHAVGLVSGEFGTPPGTAIASIAIAPAAELLDLQQSLVEALVPFTESGGSAAAFVTTAAEPHVGDTIISYVDQFVPAHCAERYSPQITLGVGTAEFVRKLCAKPFEDFAFSPGEIGVYQLGELGTARLALASWPLHRT
jgi:hypothetical protein